MHRLGDVYMERGDLFFAVYSPNITNTVKGILVNTLLNNSILKYYLNGEHNRFALGHI